MYSLLECLVYWPLWRFLLNSQDVVCIPRNAVSYPVTELYKDNIFFKIIHSEDVKRLGLKLGVGCYLPWPPNMLMKRFQIMIL